MSEHFVRVKVFHSTKESTNTHTQTHTQTASATTRKQQRRRSTRSRIAAVHPPATPASLIRLPRPLLQMSIKLIYVRIAEKQECIEFGANITTNEDLKGKLTSI